MSVTLVLLDLTQLESLRVDPSHLDGMPVAIGALPPRFILDAARGALREGKPAVWFSTCAFVDRELNQVIGAGGFKGSPIEGRVEIGYGVAEQCRGRGLGTAAVCEVLQAAFLEPGVIEAYAETASGNVASRRVLEKVGFRHLGQRPTEGDGIVDQWLRLAWRPPRRSTPAGRG